MLTALLIHLSFVAPSRSDCQKQNFLFRNCKFKLPVDICGLEITYRTEKMSQKVTKRSRRHTEEEPEQEVKMNGDSGNKEENVKSEFETSVCKEKRTNGEAAEVVVESTKRVIQTRSQSTEMKNAETTKGNVSEKVVNNVETVTVDDTSKNGELKPEVTKEDDGQEVEPLAEEGTNQELQKDKVDSDVVSDDTSSTAFKESNQLINEPMPKVLYIPMERLPVENNSVGPQSNETLDMDTSDSYSSISIDNISTKAVVGSDATRNTDLTYQDTEFEDSAISNLLINLNHSLGNSLKRLSSRRTIHPISNQYRKIAIHNSRDFKGDAFKTYESVEMVDNELKRKNRSLTPEESKRFKKDGYGFLSYISSPLFSHFKNSTDKSNSTPKLIAYEKQVYGYGDDIQSKSQEMENEAQARKWCSIM